MNNLQYNCVDTGFDLYNKWSPRNYGVPFSPPAIRRYSQYCGASEHGQLGHRNDSKLGIELVQLQRLAADATKGNISTLLVKI